MTKDDAAKIADTDIVSLEFGLPDAPEKVWRALTRPEIVARWIGGEADGRAAEDDRKDRHELLDVEKGRRVSYRWREGAGPDSIVTFSIAPDAVGGTRLTIVHWRGDMASVAVARPLACRVSFEGRAPVACAANLNLPRARAA